MADSSTTRRKKFYKFESLAPIARHSIVGDLWLVIDNKVLDLSCFNHPGGMDVLLSIKIIGWYTLALS